MKRIVTLFLLLLSSQVNAGSLIDVIEHSFVLQGEHFQLLKVAPELNEQDYVALVRAKPFIHRKLGSEDWPSHDFTLGENLATLVKDKELFESGENYTYHILEKKTKAIIGCIYLTPELKSSSIVSVSGFYWFTPNYQKEEFMNSFANDIAHWLKDLLKIRGVSFSLN